MSEFILTKNNIDLLALSDDTQKYSGEIVAKLASRIIELEAEISALQARLADLENGRPMETAPRDGTEILAEVQSGSESPYFDIVSWDAEFTENWFIKSITFFEDVPEPYVLRWWPLPGSVDK